MKMSEEKEQRRIQANSIAKCKARGQCLVVLVVLREKRHISMARTIAVQERKHTAGPYRSRGELWICQRGKLLKDFNPRRKCMCLCFIAIYTSKAVTLPSVQKPGCKWAFMEAQKPVRNLLL